MVVAPLVVGYTVAWGFVGIPLLDHRRRLRAVGYRPTNNDYKPIYAVVNTHLYFFFIENIHRKMGGGIGRVGFCRMSLCRAGFCRVGFCRYPECPTPCRRGIVREEKCHIGSTSGGGNVRGKLSGECPTIKTACYANYIHQKMVDEPAF